MARSPLVPKTAAAFRCARTLMSSASTRNRHRLLTNVPNRIRRVATQFLDLVPAIPDLNAECRYRFRPGQLPIEDKPRNKDRGKYVGYEADDQRDGKTLHWSRPK